MARRLIYSAFAVFCAAGAVAWLNRALGCGCDCDDNDQVVHSGQ